jgi:hypothetical protein
MHVHHRAFELYGYNVTDKVSDVKRQTVHVVLSGEGVFTRETVFIKTLLAAVSSSRLDISVVSVPPYGLF